MTTSPLGCERRRRDQFLGGKTVLKQIVLIAALIATPALAQQAPPTDPVAATYAQLLGEANGRVAALSGQLVQANARIAEMQKQIDAAKPKVEPTPTETP